MEFVQEYGALLGGTAIFILYVTEKVLTHLKNRGIDLQKMANQMTDMHETLEKEDEEGVKLCYHRSKTMEAILEKMVETQATQTELMQTMHQTQLLAIQTLKQVTDQNAVMMDRQVQILTAVGSKH